MLQAGSVVNRIRRRYPQLEVEVSRVTTRGDSDRDTCFGEMGAVGVFVRELETALFEDRIDLAVHSLKDMPVALPPGLCLAAVTERLDPRDVLVSRAGGLNDLASGARIGTGSLRRAVQVASFRPDLEVCGIRGNVDTRVRKVAAGEVDGVILAAAALQRLGWEERIVEYLPLDYFLPAPGQGALAVEIRSDDERAAEIVAFLHHQATGQSVAAERAFLQALGGGCRAAIAALGTVYGATLRLEGMAGDGSSGRVVRASLEGDGASPEMLGERLAERVLETGAAEFIAGVGQ